MARVLVVYESMFGDAREIAEAIAGGMRQAHAVECVEVGAAPDQLPEDLALLVVGAPNHGFGLPRTDSRASAALQADEPLVSRGRGVREWLDVLPPNTGATAAVTFDTRMEHPKALTTLDHAAGTAARRLRKLGFHIAADSAHFYVQDVKGPLVPGEVERARDWGRTLVARVC